MHRAIPNLRRLQRVGGDAVTEIQWLIDTFFVDHKLKQYLRRRRPGMSKRAFYRLRGHVRRHGIPPQTILVSEGGSPFMLPPFMGASHVATLKPGAVYVGTLLTEEQARRGYRMLDNPLDSAPRTPGAAAAR